MKDVETANRAEAQIGGVDQVSNFTIQASVKAFEILLDGLYSDKPRAIVRELSTNAFDSHLEAGKADVPFKLTLPTRYDPIFSVRDFGVSLTHEQIIGTPDYYDSNGVLVQPAVGGLYTTLFASTKDQDNTTVGKFGLGSKVPFAYKAINSFGVTTWKDGIKRVYSCFRDKGIPRVALFGEEPSDEPQGLEVSFPVEDRDVAAFTAAARRVVLGFPLKPDSNVELLGRDEITPTLSGAGWDMYRRDSSIGLSGLLVRQGCVLYPVDASALQAHHHSEALSAIVNESVIMDMPIGSVEITPSRESLSYDDTTINNLLTAVDGMFADFVAQANSVVSGAVSYFDAVKARALVLSGIDNKPLQNYISNRLEWRGRKLDSNHITIPGKRRDTMKRHGLQYAHVVFNLSKARKRVEILSTVGSDSFQPSNMPVFVYYTSEAPPVHIHNRLEAVTRSLQRANIHLLRNFTPNSRGHAALLASLGRPSEGIELVDLMTFAYTKPDFSKTLAAATKWDGNSRFKTSSFMPTAESENVFYVHTVNGNPKRGSVEYDTSVVRQVTNDAAALNIIPNYSTIVGIPASRKDLAKNIPDGWTDLFDHVEHQMLLRLDIIIASKAEGLASLRNNSDSAQITRFFGLLGDYEGKIIDKDSETLRMQLEIIPFFDAMSQGRFQQSLLSSIQRAGWMQPELREQALVGFDPKRYSETFWSLIQAHNAAYPLIGRLITHSTFSDGKLDDVVDYINLRDVKLAADRRVQEEREDAIALAVLEGEGGSFERETFSDNVVFLDNRKAA